MMRSTEWPIILRTKWHLLNSGKGKGCHTARRVQARCSSPLLRKWACRQTLPVVSDYVPHVLASWPYHAIDVAHSAVGHSQSPDPLSGTCFQTNSETPTVLSLHSDTHWRHCSSTSISVLQHIRGVAIMRYINLHFTYLLTYCRPPVCNAWPD